MGLGWDALAGMEISAMSTALHTCYQLLPAVAYFFQAGVLFSSENAKGTAFSKVHSENINTNPHIFLMISSNK